MSLKRFMDLSLSLVAVIVLSPFLLALTILMYLTQGGPVLFKQPRIGLKGKVFYLYKLRTMKPLKDGEDPHSMDRLTPMGKFIRSLSLDELPSLINIIKGEMSLVGPRPLLVQYLHRYSNEEMRRHDVLPGLTGWAQVNGRNTLSWSDKFRYDVWYARNRSFLFDLKVIFLTFKTLIVREGINATGTEIMEEFDPGLYILGAGGHSKVVISALKASDKKIMGIFDDNENLHGQKIMGIPVLGSLSDSRKYKVKKAVIGIGSNAIREKIAKDYPYNYISVIHPSAVVDNTATIGAGSVVFAGVVINPQAVIGQHAIINTSSVIEHDCLVEDFAHISPTSVLTGGVTVEKGSLIGAGTKIIPGKRVGRYCTLGAGSVVTKDIPDFSTAVGTPAVIIKEQVSHIQRMKA